MVKIVCKDKVFYDNVYNNRYIVTSYDNGYQIIKIISPYKGCWINNGTLKGFNLKIVL